MKTWPKALELREQQRRQSGAWRELPQPTSGVDFWSNDYLGMARDSSIALQAHQRVAQLGGLYNGATGSRLISGNHPLLASAEAVIAPFHQAEAALLFQSGYDANLGFFQSVPQKEDVVLYDELCHASIRDGIRQGFARSYKIRHNDTDHLAELLARYQGLVGSVYVVTESVFSMDGDAAPLEAWSDASAQFGAFLVVDEAHAIGVFGEHGQGLVCELGLAEAVFARVVTFGKALGCHGAAILGSQRLRDYLINFARSLIYTTALCPHSCATIEAAYQRLMQCPENLAALRQHIVHFNQLKKMNGLSPLFIYSKSAIHCAVLPGIARARHWAASLNAQGFAVKAILSPTVPEGQERLRFCLHSYQTTADIEALIQALLVLQNEA